MTRTKTPFFFLALPTRADRRRLSELYAPVEPLFRDAGIAFVNPLDDFLARVEKLGNRTSLRRYLWINGANAHPGPFSTHFYATVAADWLEKRYRSRIGPRSPSVKAPPPDINDATPPIDLVRIGPGVFSFDVPWSPEYLL